MVTFCISCWPPERGTRGLAFLHSLACMLTCPWFLFNSHEAMTRNNAERETQTKKKKLGRGTKVPSSPKKLEAVIIQRRLNVMDAYGSVLHPDSAYLPASCQDKRPRLEVSNFAMLDRSKVTNGSHCWKKVAFKHSARQWGGILPWQWLLNHCQGN